MKKNKKYSIDLKQYIHVDPDSAWTNVSNRIGNAVPQKRRLYTLKRTFATAAAMLAVSFLILLTHEKSSKNHLYSENYLVINSIVKSDIKVPTIILENGHNVALQDSINEIKTIDYLVENNSVLTKPDSVKERKERINTVVIPAKYTYTVILADGSEVIMNAKSKLHYPVSFSGENRRVKLEGEAYFKIKKSEYPFIVSVNGADIKVYGTEFNVNVFRENEIEIVLINGSVGVTTVDLKETMMKPKQLYSLNCLNGVVELKDVNINNYSSWKDNMFDFEQVPVTKILENLSQWYDVEFIVQNKTILTKLVDVYADRGDDLLPILEALEKIANINFIRESNSKFIVKSKKI